MAKRKKKASVNKSEAIRECFAENPDAKPKAAAEALAEKGIAVSAVFVSTIRSTAKRHLIRQLLRLNQRLQAGVRCRFFGERTNKHIARP